MAKLIDINGLARFRDDLLGGMTLDMMCDDVMIVRVQGDNIYQAKLDTWPAIQTSGNSTVLGVAIVERGTSVVIAPDQKICAWSGATGDFGGGIVTDKESAINDFDGRGETAAHLEYEACRGEDYANGYCNAYSRLNAQGYGYAAGEWWLPSLGELELIFAHLYAVRYALSLIDGATPIPLSSHWASTQYSALTAWRIDFSSGMVGRYQKDTTECCVRPVTALK